MKPDQHQTALATFFFALAHKRRQMLCDILLTAGKTGLTFGTLQKQSGLTAAALSHHLRFMDKGGILKRRAKGCETWLTIDAAYMAKAAIHFGEQTIRRPQSFSNAS